MDHGACPRGVDGALARVVDSLVDASLLEALAHRRGHPASCGGWSRCSTTAAQDGVDTGRVGRPVSGALGGGGGLTRVHARVGPEHGTHLGQGHTGVGQRVEGLGLGQAAQLAALMELVQPEAGPLVPHGLGVEARLLLGDGHGQVQRHAVLLGRLSDGGVDRGRAARDDVRPRSGCVLLLGGQVDSALGLGLGTRRRVHDGEDALDLVGCGLAADQLLGRGVDRVLDVGRGVDGLGDLGPRDDLGAARGRGGRATGRDAGLADLRAR